MGTQLPLLRRGRAPQFLAHICCGQMAGWIKMPLDMDVGLGPGDSVLDGDPAPPPQKVGGNPPIFGPCLLRPNCWINRDGTWYGGWPQARRHCVRWVLSSRSPKRGLSPLPNFRPMSVVAKGWMDQDGTSHGGGPWSRPHCAR